MNMKKQSKHHEALETYIHPPLWVCKIICHDKIAKMDAKAENYLGSRFVFLTIHFRTNYLFI